MTNKFTSIRNLVERNRNYRLAKNIRFPFFVIEPNDQKGTVLKVRMQSDLKKMLVNSNRDLKIYGDLEILSEIPPSVIDPKMRNK